jgi:glycerol-3-phosphate dehydrogenase (NAD(P)+)
MYVCCPKETRMQKNGQKTVFIGAGAIGTALGNIISETGNQEVVLHSIETDVVNSINNERINSKYFPSQRLDPGIRATTDNSILNRADVIFLAIPSFILIDYLESIRDHLKTDAILVNLAKGFGKGHKTIIECLKEQFPNPVCTLKGPSFAKEIINRIPTGFTLGCTEEGSKEIISGIFKGTPIYLDHTSDLIGVELLSILKNMYAILLGIVDAQFDSPNIRFLILTKAFNEMKNVLLIYKGEEETLFKYCGYGDFTMTSLNDLSRNRTLGLLIGKGFFTEHVSHELVLEGKVAVNIFFEEISRIRDVSLEFPIIAELYKILNQKYDISGFVNTVLSF